VLEAIGAKRRSRGIKTESLGINYQDSISAPHGGEADNDAATQEGDDEGDDEGDFTYEDPQVPTEPEFILLAVDKESAYLCYRFQP
jgi:hypothetical protein